MPERGVGRPWTAEEDSLLIQAVATHGEIDNWKTIALSVPDRTNKACRKRWLHSLSPSVKKSAWTPEEDQLLLSLYAIHSTKWAVIARHISGRTDDACSKRYREALDPALKRGDWTSDEDAKLLEAYARVGGKWGQIGQELQRSGLGCRNRWRMLQRKQAATARGTAPASSSRTGLDHQEEVGSTPNTCISGFATQPQDLWAHHAAEVTFAPTRPTTQTSPHLRSDNSPLSVMANDPPSISSSASSYSAVHPLDYGDFALTVATPETTYMLEHRASDSRSLQVSHSRGTRQAEKTSSTSYTISNNDNVELLTSALFPHTGDYMHFGSDGILTASSSPEGLSPPKYHNDEANHAMTGETPVIPSYVGIHSPTSPCQESQSSASTAPISYYRTAAEKVRKAIAPRRTREGPPPRLSSNLPATANSAVLAYACGHSSCWPTDAPASRSCYATSKELADHNKAEHPDDMGGNSPFRCGLIGCIKSWKSINGLQYHLQVSKTHFQQALSSVTQTPPRPEPEATSVSRDAIDSLAKRKKTFPCPQPGCRKEYKQLSGLRYHLAHGHLQELPMQLDAVPPTLARKMSEKAQPHTARTC